MVPITREAVGVAWECAQEDILRTQAKQAIRVCLLNRCLLRKCNAWRSFLGEANWPQAVEERGQSYKAISADHALDFSLAEALGLREQERRPYPLPVRQCCLLVGGVPLELRLPVRQQYRAAPCSS